MTNIADLITEQDVESIVTVDVNALTDEVSEIANDDLSLVSHKKTKSLKEQFHEKRVKKKQKQINHYKDNERHNLRPIKEEEIPTAEELAMKVYKGTKWNEYQHAINDVTDLLTGYLSALYNVNALLQISSERLKAEEETVKAEENNEEKIKRIDEKKMTILRLVKTTATHKNDISSFNTKLALHRNIAEGKKGRVSQHEINDYLSHYMDLSEIGQNVINVLSDPISQLKTDAQNL